MKMTKSESAKAYREKYWSEIDSDGKICRLRDVVRHLQCTVERLKIAVAQLELHRHVEGELYRPIHKDFGNMYEGTGAPSERAIIRRGPGDDDVYF